MYALTIAGLLVDLPEEAAVALSYQVADLNDLQSRSGGFSETFTLPYTHRNARVLETAHALDSETSRPYALLPAELRYNDVLVFSGTALLERSSESGYELLLVSAAGALFAAVASQPLSALDLSMHDHVLTSATVQAAQSASGAYTYPLVNDGRLTRRVVAEPGKAAVHYAELSPAAFTSDVLAHIVSAALPGFTLAGSLLTDPRFQRHQLLSGAVGPRRRQAYLDTNTAKARTTQAVTVTSERDTGGVKKLLFSTTLLDPGQRMQVESVGADTYSIYQPPPGYSEYRIMLEGEVEASTAGGGTVVIAVSSTELGSDEKALDAKLIWNTVGLDLLGTPVKTFRQRIKLEFNLSPNAGPFYMAIGSLLGPTATLLPGATVTITPGARAYEGSPVHLDACLPDWSQEELLLLLANQFGAIFQVDPARETVRADRLVDLLAQPPADWTNKLDFTTRPRLSYRLGSTARQNEWRYADAPGAYADLPDPGYVGSGLLLCPDATLEVTAEAYTAPGPALRIGPAVQWTTEAGTLALPWLPRFNQKKDVLFLVWYPGLQTPAGFFVYAAGRYWKAKQTTLLYPSFASPNEWQPVAEADIFDGPTDAAGTCALFTALTDTAGVLVGGDMDAAWEPTASLTSEGLDFAADLLPAYFGPVADVLQRVRALEVDVRLNAADIATLDFTRPVRLNVLHWPGVGPLQGDFYLNLIDQYQPGSTAPVRCELVALNGPIVSQATLPGRAGIFDYTFDYTFN